jgi:hypothetical protein
VKDFGMLELLDIFVEADRLVDFTRFFTHSGTKQVRSRDALRPLLILDLFAEGTNMGIKRMANSNDRYSYEELLYVRKMYFSPEALRNANAAVVNKLLEIRNPRLWGEGHACSSDGKRFPSWSQNLMSEWRSRYHGDGVLVYWHVETGAICIYSQLRSLLINTILIQRTIDRQGLLARLQPEDFRALTPLFYAHINPYGLFELDLEGPSFLEPA